VIESPETLPWMLSLARSSFHNQKGDLSFSGFLNRLWQEMEKANVHKIARSTEDQIRRSMPAFQFAVAPQSLQELAIEAFFYLIRNGYAVEKSSIPAINLTLPRSEQHRWTERGTLWIEGEEPVPESVDQYLRFLRSRVIPLDEIIEQYIVDALKAFERQAHFASAVMLGAASEEALYLLAESMLDALEDGNERKKLRGLLYKERSLLRLLDYVRKVLDDSKLPFQVSEGAHSHLMTIDDAIRVQRIDAVHPAKGNVSETSVRLLLVALLMLSRRRRLCGLGSWAAKSILPRASRLRGATPRDASRAGIKRPTGP
jgi:hypothetical protein